MTTDAELLLGLTFDAEPTASAWVWDAPEVIIRIDIPGLVAEASMPWRLIAPEMLASFLREIDRDWRGWEGEKSFAPAENSLRMTAQHDGLGHISLWIRFWDGWPMAANYRVEALLMMEAGRSGVLADVLEHWIDAVWLGRTRCFSLSCGGPDGASCRSRVTRSGSGVAHRRPGSCSGRPEEFGSRVRVGMTVDRRR